MASPILIILIIQSSNPPNHPTHPRIPASPHLSFSHKAAKPRAGGGVFWVGVDDETVKGRLLFRMN